VDRLHAFLSATSTRQTPSLTPSVWCTRETLKPLLNALLVFPVLTDTSSRQTGVLDILVLWLVLMLLWLWLWLLFLWWGVSSVVCGIGFGQLLDHLGGLHHRSVHVVCGALLSIASSVLLLLLLLFAIVFASAEAIGDPASKSFNDANVFDPLLLTLVIVLRVCSRSARRFRGRFRFLATERRVDTTSLALDVRLLWRA
jgi:hypothetical protein